MVMVTRILQVPAVRNYLFDGKQMDTITVLGWFVLATLSLAIARQLSEQNVISYHGFPYYKFNKKLLESFENNDPALVTDPYNLLGNVLPPSSKENTLTAQSCYETDFLAQSAKVGNYIQRTNNFRHATPDNCSSPLTEFVGKFYSN